MNFLFKNVLKKISFHYLVYSILFLALIFSYINLVTATTPNPGHPWSQVGDGIFSIIGPTAPREYTFPDVGGSPLVLTSAAAVTVGQGGTGRSSFSAKSILTSETGAAVDPLVIAPGQSIRRNAGDTSFEAYTPSVSIPYPSGPGIVSVTSGNVWGTTYTTTGSGTVLALQTSPEIITSIIPKTNDGATLGDATHNFSDLYLATGGVINYGNGNVVLTHSSGTLTLGTGTLKITTPTNTANSVVTIDGTQTLTLKTLTSPNINEAVVLSTTSTKLNYLKDATGMSGTATGKIVFDTTPTFVTNITTPLVIGGTTTTSDLFFKTTSGVGTTGADMHFLVGNNGATEAMTILNNGNVGIGNTNPGYKLDVTGDINTSDYMRTQGIRIGGIRSEKVMTVNYPNGVSQQAVDIILPTGTSFWGSIQFNITGTYANINGTGRYTPRWSGGMNPGGALYDSQWEVESDQGFTADRVQLSGPFWDSTNSRWYFILKHRVSAGNSYYIQAIGITANAAALPGFENMTVGAVYVYSGNIPNRDNWNLNNGAITYDKTGNNLLVSGSLGIGTTAPYSGTILDVNGTMGLRGILYTVGGDIQGMSALPGSAGPLLLNKLGGNVGIGQTTPTAALHLKAGTATAGTAPLKLTSGTNLTTAETGAMEYDGTNLYFTPTGTTRRTVAYTDSNIDNGTSGTLKTGTIELGHATDTTLSRSAAGVLAVEGTAIPKGTGTNGYNAYWNGTNTLGSEQYTAVGRGGTGVGTFTTNGVLYGNGATSILASAAGTTGQLLIANGTGVPTFVTMSGGDATILASGALTLSTVNTNVGTWNNVTVNGKGLVTAGVNVAYLLGNQTITLSGDASGSGTTSIAVSNSMLSFEDNRTISPSELSANKMRFGFTSFANNNTSPYADFLHLRSYQDASGGNDNLVMFRKDSIGMRVYQQAFGSITSYSSYRDAVMTDVGAASVTLSGALAMGTNTITSGLINGQTISSAANFTGTLAVAGAVTLTTDLGVASGGTGVSTFATNGVLYGNGATSILATAQGAANTVLVANANAPSFSAAINVGTSVSSPVFQGISAATIFGNATYGTTINGLTLAINPTAWTATPTISGLVTATLGLTANGALTANGVFTLGDNGDLGSINTSDWDISTAGALSGITGIANDGAYTQTGTSANTFTGTSTFSNATYSALFTGGNVGIGTATPTAALHLKAGTATAGTAPLKLTSGTVLTTTEAGAVEFNNDAYYGTITTGAARKTFAFLEAPVFTTSIQSPTIELGHATDTTLSRSAAGVLAVEGTAIPKGTGTTNELAYWSGTNTLSTLAVATYPTLAELSYVKGVTSGIQGQIGGKQTSHANLTSLSGLTYASPSFVKMTGANTFTLDTNTYLTSSTGVSTFSGGSTGLIPSSATSGAITLGGTLAVASGGTGTGTGTTINGTAITYGTTNTIAAAAGTLTGTTLASGVTGSSLTSVGTLTGLTATGNVNLSGANMVGASPLSFDGTTVDAIKTTFLITDPTTTSKTITFPNETGTVCTTGLVCTGYQASITSGTANYFWATPNGAAGAPSLRLIVASDIPTLDQNTNGYAANVAGGLGGQVLYQSAVNTTAKLANGTADQILSSQGTTLAPQWVTAPVKIVNTSNLFSNFSGTGSGVTGISDSMFFGVDAGSSATSAGASNFFGVHAGYGATTAYNSNFYGSYSGSGATNAFASNFFGYFAGATATYASYSNFFGTNAGNTATNADNANFFGNNAGKDATNANNSNFFGKNAGNGAANASYSNLFGYQAGMFYTGNNIGSNNIIMGTNISLPNAAANSINLGGVLFAKNTYATTTGNPSITPTATGSIGVGIVSPTARLHLAAGTATAGTAPLKFTSGTVNTTAETGAMEYDGTNLFFTPTGTTKRTVAYTDSAMGLVTVANESADTTTFPMFSMNATGDISPKTNAAFTFNSATGLLSSTLFAGAMNGTLGATTANTIVGTTIQANTGFIPDANDGAYLGTSGSAFSDLFLASGAVINFAGGASMLTHSANTLTLGGSGATTLALGTNSLTLTGSVGSTGARATKLWATDLQTTNAPVIDSLTASRVLVSGASKELTSATTTTTQVNYLSSSTGTTGTATGKIVFDTTPTFVTNITTPLVIGGATTTSDLFFKTTSGVGAAGADMHFLVGNNGATEAMTILNNGNIGIGEINSQQRLSVSGNTIDVEKQGFFSTDNQLLASLKGGLYLGRTGLTENQWAVSQTGVNWNQSNANYGAWTGIAMSSDGKIQSATDPSSGYIYNSTDYGITWTQSGSPVADWGIIAMSSDGKIQSATPGYLYGNAQIFYSTDYGLNWTASNSGNSTWVSIAVSSDGKIQTALNNYGYIYISNDYGATWVQSNSALNYWSSVAMSSDGKIQTATTVGDYIYYSRDYGVTWIAANSPISSWLDIAMSSDGKIQTATDGSSGGYLSEDYGVSWTAAPIGPWGNINIIYIAMSADGRMQSGGSGSGYIYTSNDYGLIWLLSNSASSAWGDIAMSSDGKIQAAVDQNYIYYSHSNSYTNGNIGLGTSEATNLLSLSGTAARTIWMERNTIAGSEGQGLTISSGGAIAGTADLAGGDLSLKSGISTGTGESALRFYTATASTTGVSDNNPTEKMTILGSGKVGIGTATPVYKLDVFGTAATDGIRTNIGLDFNQVISPVAGSLALVNDGGSGSLSVGTYIYGVTYTTALGETAAENYVSIATDATHKQVTVTIPVSTDPRVTGRKIYRTTVSDGNNGYYWSMQYVGTVSNNTATTWNDNVADSALTGGEAWQYANTTNNMLTINGTKSMLLDTNATIIGVNSGGTGGGTIIGSGSGTSQNQGIENYFVGKDNGFNTTTGQGNVAIGRRHLYYNTTGSSNIAIGYFAALAENTTGNDNIAMGYTSMNLNTTGSDNIAMGRTSLNVNVTGSYNVAIGRESGLSSIGNQNIFLGPFAGKYETGSYGLIIDNLDRGTAALSKTSALIYGLADNTPSAQILSLGGGGKVGIGTIAPSARLHLAAGTATAGTAPLKLTSGTLLTTREAGAIEYDGSHLYFTAVNGGPQYQLDQQSGGGLTVGTSTITSGTTGRVLYDNAGVLGEMTTTGSGTVLALATSPSFVTSVVGDATFSVFNTVSTNISAFGAATTLNLGAGTTSLTAFGTTSAATLSIGSGATTSGLTKTLNFGSNGATGSTSNINIGTGLVGTGTITLGTATNGTTNIAGPFQLAGTGVTTTATKLNYLTGATGTTGTNTTSIVFSTSPALTTPTVVTSIVGGATFSAFNTVTTNLSLGGAATTMTIGGTPTTAITHNYSTNATASGVTKTLNFGTGGAAGSITNINIGSSIGGVTTVSSPTLALGTGSLTLTGSVGATGARVTKLWATDLEMTNLPSVAGVALTTTIARLNYLTGTTGTTGTNTTNLVFSTSPTLTTPILGVATGTSLDVSGVLESGTNGGTGGQLTLLGATSGSVSIQTAAAAGTGTIFQLPATNGANTNILQTNGAGVTSWVAAPAGGTPTLSSLIAATAGNTINNAAYSQAWQWNSLTSGAGLTLSSNSTAAASNTQRVLSVSQTGANTTAQSTVTGYFENFKTGAAGSTNIAGYFEASGATNNFAIIGYGVSKFGQPTNYTNITSIGDLSFVGTADYLVDGDRYAFRYSGNENYGMFFNGTSASYELRGGDASPALSVEADSGDTNIKGALSVYGSSVALGGGATATTLAFLEPSGSGTNYFSIKSPVLAADNTYTWPTTYGTSGYQMQTDAAGGLSWAAPGSTRDIKDNILPYTNPTDALTQILKTPIYTFNYKEGMGTGDSQTSYVGVMADEAPWAMHFDGTIINPVNTLGYMVLGLQVTNQKIDGQQKLIENFKSDTEASIEGLVASGEDADIRIKEIEELLALNAFNNKVEFVVPPLFNNDTAGFAVIYAGDKKVQVTYGEPYIAEPIVSAGLVFNVADGMSDDFAGEIFNDDVKSMVVDSDQNGFTILINKIAPRDLRFSWTAFSVRDPKIFESLMDGLVFENRAQAEVDTTDATTGTGATGGTDGIGGTDASATTDGSGTSEAIDIPAKAASASGTNTPGLNEITASSEVTQ